MNLCLGGSEARNLIRHLNSAAKSLIRARRIKKKMNAAWQ
jgi:hypothetical protein